MTNWFKFKNHSLCTTLKTFSTEKYYFIQTIKVYSYVFGGLFITGFLYIRDNSFSDSIFAI